MHDLVLILHLMVFGAWFGTDLATFHLSRRVLDSEAGLPARATLARAMLGVEVVARLCLPTTLVLGLTLSIEYGYLAIDSWWLFPIWLLGACWVLMVWTIHRDGGTGGPAVALTGVDLGVRSLVAVALLVAGVATVVAGDPFGTLWLGVKVLALATIMAIGIRVRFLLRPFSASFAALMADGPSPEREAAVRRDLRRAYPWVVGIWSMLTLAVVMAVVRPT